MVGDDDEECSQGLVCISKYKKIYIFKWKIAI